MKTGLSEKVTIPSGPLNLEGVLVPGESPKAVVISHPHPLYGGNMHNVVVGLLAQTFKELGWTTLRFNFRGVGRSQGDFDQGQGDKDDVSAAVAYLKELNKGPVVLAGYSFGAWVNARAALDLPEVAGSILVSPPQAMMDFSFLKDDSKTRLVIAGERDDYGPVEEIMEIVEKMNPSPPVKIIPGADHFFSGSTGELAKALESAMRI
jgi:alpha/beta superfamily hydrolase